MKPGNPRKTRKTLREGDVVQIPLPGGGVAFGRALPSPDLQFHAPIASTSASIDEILAAPVLFRVSVAKYATSTGRWPIIGSVPLDASLQAPVRYFREDALSGELFVFTADGKSWSEQPATLDECQGLERLAVWDPEHVESRIEDQLAGRPNKWVESLRLGRNKRSS